MNDGSFVDNIAVMAVVQADATVIQDGNDAGEDTAGLNKIRTSGNEDQEEKSKVMAGNS